MNTTVYKSKIGLELAIPLVLIYGTILIFIMLQPFNWLGVVIMFLLILFTLHTFLKTYYSISGEELFIRCGAIYHIKILISSINKIEKSNSLLSAPATSIDRLAVYYDGNKMVLISPKDKEGFIAKLILINPSIQINLNKPS